MNMKKLNAVRVVGLLIFTVAVMLACQRDSQNVLNSKLQQSSQAAQENSAMIASTQDVVNTTAGAAVNSGLTFGRFTDSSDDGSDNDECKPSVTNTIKIDRTNPDSVIISGTIIIDFGTGTTCADSADMKKGKIIDSVYIVLSKKMHVANEFITFQNYWRDSTQLDGSMSITSATGSPTVIKVDGTKVRYRDGTSTSWKGDITFTIQSSGIGNTYTSSMTVTGSWSGVTRKGDTFTANISKDVVFQAGCFGHRHKFIPVSGTIDIVSAGVSSTIDYGDGTCDRTYTVTTAGTTTEHRLG
jgi:hypothetical protein